MRLPALCRSLLAALSVVLVTCGFNCDDENPKAQVPNSDIQMKFVNFSGMAMQVDVSGEFFSHIRATVANGVSLNMEEPGYAGDDVTIVVTGGGLTKTLICQAGEAMVSPGTAYGQVTLGVGGGEITVECDSSWRPTSL